MSAPVLHQEKLLKPAVSALERGADEGDEDLRVLSLRALGNMAVGAPKKVKQYRRLLLEKFLSSLREPASTSVVSEGLAALIKVLAELRDGDLGPSFYTISQQCRAFFDNESEPLRLKAFVLFGKLAKVVRISKKHLFKAELKKAWVPLLLHCQDPSAPAAGACLETVFQCLHFRGCKGLQRPLGQSAASTDEMMSFQTAVCSILSQKKPAVRCDLLADTVNYVKSGSSRIRIAACRLAGILMIGMSTSCLKKLDISVLRNSFQELQLDTDPEVRQAALETLKVLDSCGQQRLLTSAGSTS